MILKYLGLVDVRSYLYVHWQPAPGLNIIFGPNGSGKTNLLEAIALVAGMRLRPLVHEGDLVRHGAVGLRIAARVASDEDADGNPHEIVYRLSGRSRRYLRDGTAVRAGDVGMPGLVAFTPDDLDLVKGGPEARRHLLERDLAQLSPSYRDLLRRYGRALAQRNALLRSIADTGAGEGTLEPWDQTVAALGAAVQIWRVRTASALGPRASAAYDRLAGRSSGFVVSYLPRVELDAPAGEPEAERDEGVFARRLLSALRAAHSAELARGYTLVGPHRDDLGFSLDGIVMRGFASQGEQRSAVVAIKLALLEQLHEARGERPLLALDDVLSELDEVRQERLLEEAKGYQTFVTTTSSAPGLGAAVWRTEGGGVTAWRADG